ncbi:MAG: oligoendopeptidase F [Acidobacteria bacterium]|nr:oligoendopeptidase F [Acidobacteriota bacterium]
MQPVLPAARAAQSYGASGAIAGRPFLRPQTRDRAAIPDRFKWDLEPIFASWEDWQAAYDRLERDVDEFACRRGSLGQGAESLLAAYRALDALGTLAYRVWYFPSLRHDEDQRDNQVSARHQQVQILMAKWQQATSWFNPELLAIPIETVRGWMQADANLALYRFAIENMYRQQEHVLDEAGERLMSLAGRFEAAPSDAYASLSTADARFPEITLSDGRTVTVSYGEYRSILETSRQQTDRAAAFRAYLGTFDAARNTYAALYNGVCQRDWFQARARGYRSTLDAALHGNNIPPAVVETLIAVAREHTQGVRRYHRLRKRILGLDRYFTYDSTVPLIAFTRAYDYDEARRWVVESVAPLGEAYQAEVRRSFEAGCIDVYENEGKRSGAYSAPVYGVHPYMLLNHNDTLDAVFTLAHEMGHSIHTVLAHRHQPFVYSDYTIFVAEVPSTLNEALLLEYLLAQSADPRERIVLLQHAIDNIAGTFFAQSLFADYELRAHALVEQDHPITADVLCGIYGQLMAEYYGDTFDDEPLVQATWARVPHFYSTPYYVYQYATCFASAAHLVRGIVDGEGAGREAAVARYLDLLKAGGNDYPMEQLRQAGVDLSRPETVRAVVVQFEQLVDRLERELDALT